MIHSFEIRCNKCSKEYSLSYYPDSGRYNLYDTLSPKRQRRPRVCPQCGRIRQDGLTSRLAEAAIALRDASNRLAREGFSIHHFDVSDRARYFKVAQVSIYWTCCSAGSTITADHAKDWLNNIDRFSCPYCGKVHPDPDTSRRFFAALMLFNKESQRLPLCGITIVDAKPIQYFEWKPKTIIEDPRV